MGRGLRSRRGSIVLGLLAIGVALVIAVIPNTKRYSTDGFGLFGRAQVKCGSSFDSKVDVSFDDYTEGVSYRSDVSSYGEPTIFEGKTATQVCQKADRDARTTALWVGGIGVVLFFVGLNRLNKATRTPSFAIAGAGPMSPAPSLPPLKVSTPKATVTPAAVKADNPARWTEDPFGRFELRFWDGRRWSEHVSTGGRQDIDPPKPTVVPAKQAFAPPSFDHDGHTIPRAARPTVPALVLTMSTGARIETRGLVCVGRDPSAVEGVQAVAVDDPLLSKSHLRVGVDVNGAWVEDTHSTNGVDLRGPDGRTIRLTAGVRTPMSLGSRITFGDSWCDVVAGVP